MRVLNVRNSQLKVPAVGTPLVCVRTKEEAPEESEQGDGEGRRKSQV